MRVFVKMSLVLVLLSSPSVYAAGDASQALQTVQWATAELGNAMNLSKQLEQIALLTEQLQRNIQMVQMAQQNLKALSSADLTNFNSYVDQLSRVMITTKGISYQMSDLDARFSRLYPGYDQYSRMGSGDIRSQASSYGSYYRNLADTSRGTTLGTLRSLTAVNNDMQADQVSMNILKLQSRNAPGNQAAIQAANEIALHQTETIKKLHSSMLTQTNLMAQTVEAENSKEELKRAKTSSWLNGGIPRQKNNEKSVKTWKE